MATREAKLIRHPFHWFFACPLTGEAEIHNWRLVNGLLLVLLVAMGSGLAMHLLDGDAITLAAPLLIVAVLYVANHRGLVAAVSHAIVWSSVLIVTAAWILYSTDITNVISLPALYVLPILLAGTLLGARSVAAVTATTATLTLWLYLWVLPQIPVVHSMPEGVVPGVIITALTLLGSAGGLGWEANRVIKRSLTVLNERNVRLGEEIVERMRVEEVLNASEQHYRSLFEHNQAGVVRAHLTGAILDCNDAMVRMLGYSAPSEIVGQVATDFFFDPDELQDLRATLEAESSVTGLEIGLRNKAGTRVQALTSMSLMTDASGRLVTEGTVIDITELKQKEAALEMLATHDPLTGLYNRRAMNDIMTRILRRCVEARSIHGAPDGDMSLILIDIDHFKQVNDCYGHQAGDTVLQEVARRITLATRPTDYVARYGGEEIAVLLPGVRSAEALALAERIRTKVSASPITLTSHSLQGSAGTGEALSSVQITVSLGVACGPAYMTGDQCTVVDKAQDALISIADRGLYQAKSSGRNCVVAAGTSGVAH